MIGELREAGLISVTEYTGGLVGYLFSGSLYEAYEELDRALVTVLTAGLPTTAHSAATLLDRSVLDRIGFFDKLPSIPFRAVPFPHQSDVPQDARDRLLLSPSTCYSTFQHIAGTPEAWQLRAFAARGRCHRFEPTRPGATRLGAFDMREIVLVGDADEVVDRCDDLFNRGVELLRALGVEPTVETANDVFYGERSEVTRRVQRIMGVKREVLIPGSDDIPVAVGSRNLHRSLFTGAFRIGPQDGTLALHSSCVAFGLERLVLTLLHQTPGHDPELLRKRIDRAVGPVSAGAL
ncbi:MULTISPECIES: hypothetical protein [unclassified Micromonospora]|uniref:hypothetical protein n=1 Tax=unclassified Micromonospora TaxID=2617518 RepID=UPI00332FE764